tara:strand:- start:4540 stop:4968 length:429 start_codon:yes stop_codon:yes gene_type:complete
MELELKHLAPYLPYAVQIETLYRSLGHMGGFNHKELDVFTLNFFEIEDIKPILRPLSDLTKKIEHNGEMFIPLDYLVSEDEDDYFVDTDFESYIKARLGNSDYEKHMIKYLPYGLINKLLEWHFDVFGLIEKGLAIDKNTLS